MDVDSGVGNACGDSDGDPVAVGDYGCDGRNTTAMAVAIVAMTWRGEAWKTVFLQSEHRVSELQRQLRPPISSNTEWSNPELSTLHVAECFGPRFASVRFLRGVPLVGPRTLQSQSDHGDSIVLVTSSGNTPVMHQAEGSIVYPAQYQPWFSHTGLDHCRAQNDQIRAVNNFNNQSDPTPTASANVIGAGCTRGLVSEKSFGKQVTNSPATF